MRGSKWIERHRELILYTAVGIVMTLFNWLAYSDMVKVMPMFFANTFSWGLTTIMTFLINKLYVFGSMSFEKSLVVKEFISFAAARGVTGMLEIIMQPQLFAMGMDRPLFGVEGLEAKITVCLVLSIVNYASTKLLVFRSGTRRMDYCSLHGR